MKMGCEVKERENLVGFVLAAKRIAQSTTHEGHTRYHADLVFSEKQLIRSMQFNSNFE